MAEVAFAAGFGSVRQFHRACHAVFGSTPGALRARRRSSDRLAADGGLALRVPFRGLLDFAALTAWLAPRSIPGVEHVDALGRYRRTIEVGGDPGVLEVELGVDLTHLVVRVHLPHWEGLIHIVERVRRLFALDADVGPANGALGGDGVLGPSFIARPGLRVPGAWDGFEVAVRTIIGQQVSVAAATTLAGRLVERLGHPVAGLDAMALSATFPSAEVVAGADLDGLGLTPGRSRAIRHLAVAVSDGSVVLDGSVGADTLRASLESLPGVGPWTASYLGMRLGQSDAFPVSDLGLRRAFAAAGGSADALAEASEAWRPWRALAAMHLWTAYL